MLTALQHLSLALPLAVVSALEYGADYGAPGAVLGALAGIIIYGALCAVYHDGGIET
jgi:hypothetical protein